MASTKRMTGLSKYRTTAAPEKPHRAAARLAATTISSASLVDSRITSSSEAAPASNRAVPTCFPYSSPVPSENATMAAMKNVAPITHASHSQERRSDPKISLTSLFLILPVLGSGHRQVCLVAGSLDKIQSSLETTKPPALTGGLQIVVAIQAGMVLSKQEYPTSLRFALSNFGASVAQGGLIVASRELDLRDVPTCGNLRPSRTSISASHWQNPIAPEPTRT